MPKTVTRDDIVTFIKANEHRSNPGAFLPLAFGQQGSCDYVVDDGTGDSNEPSCVIGHVLIGAGYDLSGIENGTASGVFFGLGLREEGLGQFAADIQGYADRGYTWGTALQLALIQRGEG